MKWQVKTPNIKLVNTRKMENNDTPAEYKDKFYILFVGEFWSNDPIYETWTEGRIEFRKWEDNYGNDQMRYCTEKNDEWFEFVKKYECKWITASELEELKKTVQEKFRRKPEGYK